MNDTPKISAKEERGGLGVTHPSWELAVSAIRQHFASFIPLHVITLAPEMCVRAWEDPDFRTIIDRAGLVVADGVGVAWGEGRLTGSKPEKVPGIDLATWALEEVDRIAGRVYLLGSRPEVIEKAARNIAGDFPRITLSGYHDGYFSAEEKIVQAISAVVPHLLLVGMGTPLQEQFISRHLNDLKCAVAVGVGGSIDVWSGAIRRAPSLFRATSTEWLYRTIAQPRERLKRLPILWRFAAGVLRGGR